MPQLKKKIPNLQIILMDRAQSAAFKVAATRWPNIHLGYVGTDPKTFEHYFQEFGNPHPFILGRSDLVINKTTKVKKPDAEGWIEFTRGGTRWQFNVSSLAEWDDDLESFDFLLHHGIRTATVDNIGVLVDDLLHDRGAAPMNTQQLAAFLSDAGKIEVVSIEGPTDQTDGEIELKKGYSVQVGNGYYVLNRYEGEGENLVMHSGAMRATPKDILNDCKKAGL